MPQSENNSRETLKTDPQGRSALQKLVIALVVAFLYYAGQIAVFFSESNRYTDLWETRDTIAILLGIGCLGMLAYGVDWLLRRLDARRMKRLFNNLFIFALVGGLMAAFPKFSGERPNVVSLIWIVAAAIVGASWASNHDRVVKWSGNVALILSPVLLIIPAQMFCWSTWEFTSAPKQLTQNADDTGTPVFLVVCDEWSWQRSSDNGMFSTDFPNLDKMSEQAVLFPNALSADGTTSQSLPKILFQTTQEVIVHNGATYWGEVEAAKNTCDTPSLFSLSRQNGYANSLNGFHLPYRRILGNQVDDWQLYRLRPLKGNWFGKVVVRFFDNVYYWHDPISLHFRQTVYSKVLAWHRVAVFRDILDSRESLWDVVETSPKRTFATCHFRLPHGPSVFKSDGTFNDQVDQQDPEKQYHQQLEYLDVVLGEFTERLRQNGTYDDALIVFTSDHSWRADPNKDEYLEHDPDWDRRVPLVVKLPGQQSAHTFDQSLANNQLRPLFEAVFQGERDTDRLLELLRRLPEESDQNELPISVSKSE